MRPSKTDEQNRERQLRERRSRQLDGYVGFANLPNQVYRRAVKKGFHFTLMVVGELKAEGEAKEDGTSR